jgi:lipid-binding SYLF domain-containing protein
MMKLQKISTAAVLAALCLAPQPVRADVTIPDAEKAVAAMIQADPGLQSFLDKATGYAVFPNVAKGALIVGGAGGSGYVFEKGRAVGRTTLSQASIGAQVGARPTTSSSVSRMRRPSTRSRRESGRWPPR